MKKTSFVSFVALPIVVSLLFLLHFSSGLFVPWTRVITPTDRLTNYFSVQKNPDGYPEAVQECNTKEIEFSILANKPKNIQSCVQVTDYAIDGAEHLVLAKDGQGSLWQWEFVSSVTSDMLGYFVLFLGVLCGGVIILVVSVKKRKKAQ